MPRIEYTERTVIIVLDMEAFPVGLIVDHVSEVVEIAAGSIDPSPTFQGGHRSDGLVMGLGKYGDRV
ncbi:chemotaxis protein CheW, partial [Pasteurella multocida]